MELGMEYIPPEIDSNYGSNNSIFTSPGMEDSVFKLSRIFLDHLFNGNLLPNNTIDQLIEDPDSAQEIFFGENFQETWIEMAKGSSVFFGTLVIGLFFTVTMTLVWFMFLTCCTTGLFNRVMNGVIIREINRVSSRVPNRVLNRFPYRIPNRIPNSIPNRVLKRILNRILN